MTKRPQKTQKRTPPPAASSGMLELRNRMILAVGVMAIAGVLLWKPWTGPIAPAGKVVAAAPAPKTEDAPKRSVIAAAITAPPVAQPTTAQPSPAMTIALNTPNVPLPPSPPPSARMPASLQADFDAWLIETYRACWSPPGGAPDGEPYYPRVRVALKADGGLAGQPKLVNPPPDPAWKGHADAALKAVKSCDPLKIPDKFAPYHAQWKSKTVFFDPTKS